MNQFKQAVKQQFGCTKSIFKMHNYAYALVANSQYTVKEVCLKCHQPRD